MSIDLDELDIDLETGPNTMAMHIRLHPALVAAVDRWIGRRGPPFVIGKRRSGDWPRGA